MQIQKNYCKEDAIVDFLAWLDDDSVTEKNVRVEEIEQP